MIFNGTFLQVWYPVTTAMGKPSFNGSECIKEVGYYILLIIAAQF
jgi:hypothetical protein